MSGEFASATAALAANSCVFEATFGVVSSPDPPTPASATAAPPIFTAVGVYAAHTETRKSTHVKELGRVLRGSRQVRTVGRRTDPHLSIGVLPAAL